jgi:hypothetical protein
MNDNKETLAYCWLLSQKKGKSRVQVDEMIFPPTFSAYRATEEI